MKFSNPIILCVIFRLSYTSGYSVKPENSSPIYKQAIENCMKQSHESPIELVSGALPNMPLFPVSLASAPRARSKIRLKGPPNYWFHPKIHTFGNTGFLGAIHAALAPMVTKLIDVAAYKGENVRHKIARTLRTTVGKGNARVLDLCCGVGMSTRALQGAFQDAAAILGIDTSKEMIAMAKMLSSDSDLASFLVDKPKLTNPLACSLDYTIGNAEQTNLPAGGFDLVTIMYAFHEVPYHGRYRILREARRLLADGATLAVIDISPKYEPSPSMLAGEPYVLEYKANIQKQLQKFQGFANLRYEEVVAGHVGVWVLTRKNANTTSTLTMKFRAFMSALA
jgi:SAM-dependent methyltransferase